ncbi:MAG: hypothetical protein FWB90_09210 [Fibromonadales bacterium]|nr:hypothetical protein [Fibromonadales bacterium]
MIANSDYGTKMDDVILESLKPQVEEIKKRIAGGGGLSHEDIITLTLYTQGNHINHLDMRMDSLCEDFSSLRTDFATLRADIYEKMSELQTSFTKMTAIIGSICAAAIALATVITNILNK